VATQTMQQDHIGSFQGWLLGYDDNVLIVVITFILIGLVILLIYGY
jgi:hypothetical protein